MTFEEFKEWLDKYNFVRTLIREALMPRIWSLTDFHTVLEPNKIIKSFNKSGMGGLKQYLPIGSQIRKFGFLYKKGSITQI